MHLLRTGLAPALTGAVVLGAFATFGDWVWARYLRDGAVIAGVVHGASIFLILAAVLAWNVGTRRATARLLPALPATGVVLAAAFYPLAAFLGYLGALLVTWVLMWLATAALERWARGGVEAWPRTLLRGTAAAIGSGLAFWAISGIWTNPSPGGPSYPWHFACWTFAFLPGFLALLVTSPIEAVPAPVRRSVQKGLEELESWIFRSSIDRVDSDAMATSRTARILRATKDDEGDPPGQVRLP